MWRAYVDMCRYLLQALDRQFAATGLSSADYELLVPLSEAPGQRLRARDLGRSVHWDRSRLSHQLRRMEQRGLLKRQDCPDDARGVTVHLTPEGRAAIEAAAPGHVETVRRLFVDQLTPEEIDALTTISYRVLSRIAKESLAPGKSVYVATIDQEA
ncbi:DNA-binding transcriptional regulator, MarR family [Nonomuraea jiangxiensis]|uniref:DNA-binding transcriptional regulator, MarR family n=2 Tax=Nonomuraea jiangxiensis TaxID=633440 RepID=A0A1G9P615_9ACTN|nr:DNA-binding transcriptional regulator, MarR family [Nonomuraea jiangxiensis]